MDGGGEPGAGGRFRFAEWSVVRLGCGGVRVKNNFVFTNLDLIKVVRQMKDRRRWIQDRIRLHEDDSPQP